jgi:hypothetical protein
MLIRVWVSVHSSVTRSVFLLKNNIKKYPISSPTYFDYYNSLFYLLMIYIYLWIIFSEWRIFAQPGHTGQQG